MLKFTPILLAVGTGLVMWLFSSFRLKRELNQRSTPLTDPLITAHVDSFAEALELPRIPVHVYEIPELNGLAAPDGRVFVTRGFLERYRLGEITSSEIASVVAHELGHVALGHTRRRMIEFSGQNALRFILMMVLGRFIPFIGPMIANFLTGLLAARLSRRDEFEADAYAAALMTRAGLGTGPQISMFEKLEAAVGGNRQFAWMMSHPKTHDRIEAVRRLDSAWDDTGTVSPDNETR